MTTLNDAQIIASIRAEYKKTSEQMIAQAKEAVSVLQHNLSIKELGDHDWQVNEAVEQVNSFKDVDILDEVQSGVLGRFISDDQQIEELDIYDQTCDLRSYYQDELNEAINSVVEQIKNLPKNIATDFDHNYHNSEKHSSSNPDFIDFN